MNDLSNAHCTPDFHKSGRPRLSSGRVEGLSKDSEANMSETIVPYERFLEIRRRRNRVSAELGPPPGSVPNGRPHDGEPPIIECEAVIDPDGGTRAQAVARQTSPS